MLREVEHTVEYTPIRPHFLKGMAYLIVTTQYLTKWVEIEAVKTHTAARAMVFLSEVLFLEIIG